MAGRIIYGQTCLFTGYEMLLKVFDKHITKNKGMGRKDNFMTT